jgi:Peptidase family C25
MGLTVLAFLAQGQRVYKPSSVLATGSWYRIGVPGPGIYRIDIALLNTLGVGTASLPSSTIRLFGNGGQMLPEANATPRADDLIENAIEVVDGGDGILNGYDYILFYANGPDEWIKDSANQRFSHRKNLYSSLSYYFLSIGGTGKRITTLPAVGNPANTVTTSSGRYFHELDTVNFLTSGREWYGEEFSNAPGHTVTRDFPITLPGLVTGTSLILQSSAIARSVGAASSFVTRVNGIPGAQINIPPVGSGQYDLFAQPSVSFSSLVAPPGDLIVGYTYVPGSFNAQGWLNWFELSFRQTLSMPSSQPLLFRDWSSVGPANAEFVIGNAGAGTEVWEVTDPSNPILIQGSLVNNQFHFTNNCSRLREYAAFSPANLLTPIAAGRVANQDLHHTGPADNIIIVPSSFLAQAQRLAAFHQQQSGLRTLVVTTDQVFNEFGSGSPDPTAIRDFLKMYFDVYGNDPANRLRTVLLFGDASYDYKDRLANNTNLVPCYETPVSLDILSSYTSDDFFGFLQDNEDINSTSVINTLDIGIGRVPARSIQEAKNFVDKVGDYFSGQAFGPWRNDLLFIADDEDQNLHLEDAETITATATTTAPVFDLKKIYLDAYPEEKTSAGSSYPAVNQAVSSEVFNGTLIWNFTGHGGAKRLAEETIVDQDIVNEWNNQYRLPLFMTATCDFAPYDNPVVPSLGENLLLRAKTGGIALLTTTRVVFASSNRVMNNNYLKFALQPDANGKYKNLGDAIREAKNYTYQTSTDIINNRKFTLLGDPALTIAFPGLRVRPVRINGVAVSSSDTLRATDKITIDGEVTDLAGNRVSGYNGNVYPAMFDKPRTQNTLANDPGSLPVGFSTQDNVLFKGRSTVTDGRFSFTFKVPKDINYQYGSGKLSLYAEDGKQDGNGFSTRFIVGGTGTNAGKDNTGPEIKPYLNDEKFVNGSITNETPVLILKLMDSSGINTVGTGIGHDIVATLDNDTRHFFILNDFYQGDQDSYEKGTVKFQLPDLEAGAHSLKIKAWDVLNNSSEAILDFTVAKNEELSLSHVLNYPNPFTTKTQFWFEHNKPGQDLQVRLQIFTLTGRVIKVIQKTINTPGNRSIELEWDGRDEYGDKIGRGIYLYKLSVTAPGKLRKEKIEKLVIL